MRLPGMSFEDDWTGIRIANIKANLSENPDGALIYSETRRPVTHVLLGEACGYLSFISEMPGEPQREYIFEEDIAEAYRRITDSVQDPAPQMSPSKLAMARAQVAWARARAPHLLTPWLK